MIKASSSNPDDFIQSSSCLDWEKTALSRAVALHSEEKQGAAFEKLVEEFASQASLE